MSSDGVCVRPVSDRISLWKMHHIDIRQYGSGNSGTTNALRVMGKKAGLLVFMGDFLKTVFACLLVRLVMKGDPSVDLYVLYAGLGVVLGHNFPFYLHFKGGKGIASMAGILVSMDWRVTLVCAFLFLGAVILTRYVSLGFDPGGDCFLYPDGVLRPAGGLCSGRGRPDGILCGGRSPYGHGHLAPQSQYKEASEGHRK